MALYHFNTSKNFYLSCYEPVDNSYTINDTVSIQGNTTLRFIMSSVESNIYGVYRIVGHINNVQIFNTYPTITTLTSYVTSDIIEHSHFATQGTKTLKVTALYRNGLSAVFNTTLKTVYENILEQDLTILNSQSIYVSGNTLPIINLESNDNVIYPVVYQTLSAEASQRIKIYLLSNEEPETYTTGITSNNVIYDTEYNILSASGYITSEDDERIQLI